MYDDNDDNYNCDVLTYPSDIAYKLMLDMEKNGSEPNIYTYNTVTRAFAESGRLQVH